MSITLRKRKNANGTTSLRLDIYHNGIHKIETLKHLQLAKVSNVSDRESNKELLKRAEAIRLARAIELESNNYNVKTNFGKDTIVSVWMQGYVDNYIKKDKRNMQGALNRFSDFLLGSKMPGLTFGSLTPVIIEEFIDYLQSKSVGEGASSYYNRFKKMVKHAYRMKILQSNLLDFVEKKVKGKARSKDTLTLAELNVLAATPIKNMEIRKAFLFSCVTGLRWGDVKTLKWVNINIKNKMLNKDQDKDSVNLNGSLNDTAILLLGEVGKPTDFVFKLPSANGANKTVKAWVIKAKIDKQITWHNARHSFGTNLSYYGTDIFITSKLMGHTTVKHTMRYLKAAQELKEKSTDKINIEL